MDRSSETMLYTVSLLVLFLLDYQNLVAADPIADHQRTLEQDDWCDNPSTIHRRLDAIQEQLEKTVDHLDFEVKSLLNEVSETAWTKPLAPGIPLVDLFGASPVEHLPLRRCCLSSPAANATTEYVNWKCDKDTNP